MKPFSRRDLRGVSLIEMLVVLLIGGVLIIALLPITIGLLREQRALSARVLSVEALPFLVDRIAADFARAASAGAQMGEKPLFRVYLSPAEEKDPEVTYTVRSQSVVRIQAWKDAEGRVKRESRSWRLDGSLSLDREASLAGRTVLKYTPPKGPEEYLAFMTGRPTARKAP